MGMMNKQDARRLSPSIQEEIRKRAVRAVLSGKSQTEVAQIYGVSRTSVCTWTNQAKRKGMKVLHSKKRGGQSKPWLKTSQSRAIIRIIESKHPDELGLPFVLWTREAIQALIKERFGIHLALRTITDYLARWNMTPQKPIRKAYQQDPKAVEQWLTKEYPKILARAKRQKAVIYWEDEMGLSTRHQAGRSFSLRGKTPEVIVSGKRDSIQQISAITNRGRMVFTIFKGRFESQVFIRFLQRLIRYSLRKIFLILDRHSVHLSGVVKAWLHEHKDKIEVFYLPTYSPDLNPDELLNRDIKSNVFKTKHPRNEEELTMLLRGQLKRIQRDKQRIQDYFQNKNVKYSAA